MVYTLGSRNSIIWSSFIDLPNILMACADIWTHCSRQIRRWSGLQPWKVGQPLLIRNILILPAQQQKLPAQQQKLSAQQQKFPTYAQLTPKCKQPPRPLRPPPPPYLTPWPCSQLSTNLTEQQPFLLLLALSFQQRYWGHPLSYIIWKHTNLFSTKLHHFPTALCNDQTDLHNPTSS